jgi:mRNA-degrading endonuclease RelE of RelBE toxin-antitoxin system
MQWTVTYSRKAAKQRQRLPVKVQAILDALILDIQNNGPVRGNWSNYSKLSGTNHHCHLKKGNPTFVAIWWETNKEIKIVEVTYAGTHEKAPY